MELKYQMLQNGQEVQQADLNVVGESSGLADDRTLAELVRLIHFDGSNVVRGIMPFGEIAPGVPGQGGLNLTATPAAPVAPNGATGQVQVYPFRAFVGSRTAIATDGTKNWRDIRSTVVATTTSNLYRTVTINANSAGNPRWTLVWAQITPDANGASFPRFVKDPNTGAESVSSIVTTLVTSISLGTTDGTAGASPAFPTQPADGGGNYYIPLAFIRVPNGFGSGSTVGVNDIYEVAPIIQLSPTAGTVRCSPGNGLNTPGGELQTRIPWPASGNRPGPYLPPSMTGMESRFFGLQLMTGQTASVANGDIIDQTIDWRNRCFRWHACCVGNNSAIFLAYDPGVAAGSTTVPSALESRVTNSYIFGFGQSFINEGQANPVVVNLTNAILPQMPAGTLTIYVDAATGTMKVLVSGSPNANFFIWIDATAPFANK